MILRWIVTAGIKRVTSHDPPDSFQSTLESSVLANSQNKIIATSRCKSTVSPDQRGNSDLVKADAKYQDLARDSNEPFDQFWLAFGHIAARTQILPGRLFYLQHRDSSDKEHPVLELD